MSMGKGERPQVVTGWTGRPFNAILFSNPSVVLEAPQNPLLCQPVHPILEESDLLLGHLVAWVYVD